MRTRDGGRIGSVEARRKLKARSEPHWTVITRGCALGYRKGANGGSWIARVRNEDGRQKYHAIGAADDLNDGRGLTYAEALRAAQAFFGVAAATRGGTRTVGDALTAYLRQVEANNPPSTQADARARIENILRPQLGTKALLKLQRAELEKWQQDLARYTVKGKTRTRGPDTINKLTAYLKAALNLARKNRWVADDNAWRDLPRVGGGGQARKVFLTPEQASALLEACEPPAFRAFVRAGLLTGARTGELSNALVRDFDPDTGTLQLSGKTGGRSVVLSGAAVAFFIERAGNRPADALLLPREDGGRWNKNLHQRPFQAAVKKAKLPSETVFYALRHTHVSWALKAGVVAQVVAENCGTSVRMIEKHYAKFLHRDRRAMFDKLPSI